MAVAAKYDDDSVKTLSSLEHIRTRSGMYIGRTGDGSHYDDGIYVLLKEVLDNAVDEFIMGFGKRAIVDIDNAGKVTVRDFGRGIPLGKVVECVSHINTGAKYNSDAFQFSVGMNGVGTKAVNALSRTFLVRSVREGEFSEASFEKGVLKHQKKGKTSEQNGTLVEFLPDDTIFKKFQFRSEFVERRLKMYAYLNAGLAIVYNGTSIKSSNGLLDLLNDEVDTEGLYQPFYYCEKTLEFAFTHTNRFSEDYYSFVNGQYTTDGGTHLSAFREGVLKAINEYSPKSKFDGDDVREGLVGCIAIRLKDPVFESQTKNRLGNAEIRADLVNRIRIAALGLLNRNQPIAQRLIEKIEDTKKLRNELNNVKKLSRERSKSVAVRVPQLRDSRKHLDAERGKGLDTQIFICEGLSAAGSITKTRNADVQAVFSLRGKPLNTCGLSKAVIYKNEELYNLTRALDIEDSLKRLRYQKVILATDADVDGLHIRNLMITFFTRFHESLVREGHLYILETPLFKVRNKRETYYCYNDSEKARALAQCGKAAEITRFKGLGEISPNEFREFIGPAMRLTPVDMSSDSHLQETIEFYMGKNTPDRRRYIMDNLVVNEEELGA